MLATFFALSYSYLSKEKKNNFRKNLLVNGRPGRKSMLDRGETSTCAFHILKCMMEDEKHFQKTKYDVRPQHRIF